MKGVSKRYSSQIKALRSVFDDISVYVRAIGISLTRIAKKD
jgi:hypothetical protein